MNANHRDIMEQYCRQYITSDKFSPDKSIVYPRKNCTLMSEIIIIVRSCEFKRIFKIDARIRNLAGLSNNLQTDQQIHYSPAYNTPIVIQYPVVNGEINAS